MENLQVNLHFRSDKEYLLPDLNYSLFFQNSTGNFAVHLHYFDTQHLVGLASACVASNTAICDILRQSDNLFGETDAINDNTAKGKINTMNPLSYINDYKREWGFITIRNEHYDGGLYDRYWPDFCPPMWCNDEELAFYNYPEGEF